MILICWFFQIEMESVDVDSEIDEILKKAQEATPEGNDASDIGTSKTSNAQKSNSGDFTNLIEGITLL